MNGWAGARVAVMMLLVAAAFVGWQYQGYQRERALIDESLHQQGHSIINAMVGGIASHRRFGSGFDEQLQGMLDELVTSEDVLAAAFLSPESAASISAGDAEKLQLGELPEPGDVLDSNGFRMTERFHLAPAGRGGRGGQGRGYGRGLGSLSRSQQYASESSFAPEGDYWAVLLLDRSRSDVLKVHAAQSHILTTVAGLLVIALVGLAWRSSVKMVATRGQARLLEAEAQHLRDLSQAAAGLAHETRNPLGLIRGWTQRLAQAGGDDQLRQQHARAVMEECDRVTARINQFLTYAKPYKSSLEPVELGQLVGELGTLLQPDLDAKNIALKRDLRAKCAVVRVDRELLRQSLFNLIQNAIQFSPTGGTVRVESATDRDGTCCIRVADRGPGVAAELVDSLFTPYVTSRANGTGLGLAIVKKIAELHGWQVRYQAREGGGSVFTLEGIHE